MEFLDFAKFSGDLLAPLIGSGGTARVFKTNFEGEEVALKLIWCIELDVDQIQSFFDEVKILNKLQRFECTLPIRRSIFLCLGRMLTCCTLVTCRWYLYLPPSILPRDDPLRVHALRPPA